MPITIEPQPFPIFYVPLGSESGLGATHPAVDLPVLPASVGIGDLAVFVVPAHQILDDGAALEDVDGGPVREGVREGGHPPIGVDLEEPGLLGMCGPEGKRVSAWTSSYREVGTRAGAGTGDMVILTL